MRFRSYDEILSGENMTEPGDGMGNIQNGREATQNGIIYMDIVLFDTAIGDNEYYRVAETNTATRNKAWASDNKPNGASPNPWVKFNRTADAAFTALLAKYAFIENLTAREIVITDPNNNQKPVAGMTSGQAISTDYTASLVPQSVRGNVRIWAGYDSNTPNL
jgi:hypothetical protein